MKKFLYLMLPVFINTIFCNSMEISDDEDNQFSSSQSTEIQKSKDSPPSSDVRKISHSIKRPFEGDSNTTSRPHKKQRRYTDSASDLYKEGLKAYRKGNKLSAFNLYKKAADQGNTDARYLLAQMYYEGEEGVVEKDRLKALNLFRKAAGARHEDSLNRLEALYQAGWEEDDEDQAEKDYKQGLREEKKGNDLKAFKCFEMAVARRHMGAQYALGQAYENGEDGPFKSKRLAISLYKAAANQGDLFVQYDLGLIYLEKKEKEEAIEWLTKAAEAGYEPAQYELAMICLDKGEQEGAIKWLTKAAETGHRPAKYQLAMIYLDKGEQEKAIEWLTKAAEEEDYAPAQHQLGMICLDKGEQEKAVEWLTKAANQSLDEKENERGQKSILAEGILKAQYELGKIHEANQNFEESAKCYLEAAHGGYPDAKYKVGSIFLSPDLSRNLFNELKKRISDFTYDYSPYYWLEEEAKKNHPDASYALYKFRICINKKCGININENKGLEYLEKAAALNHKDALYDLAKIKQKEQLFAEAAEQFAKAAIQEHAEALYELGKMYRHGWPNKEGEEIKNQEKAVYLLKESAQQNYSPACYELGELLLEQQNKEQALIYLKKAANMGNAQACYKLAILYEKGEIVPQSYEEVRKWCKKASQYDDCETDIQSYLKNEGDCDTDSEDEEDYDYESRRKIYEKLLAGVDQKPQAANKNKVSFIALYRGIHYLKESFATKKDRKKHREKDELKSALYSSSVYELTSNKDEYIEQLKEHGKKIREVFSNLKEHSLPSYHIIQEHYSNSLSGYHTSLLNPDRKENSEQQKQAYKMYHFYFQLFTGKGRSKQEGRAAGPSGRNPNVSFSLLPREGFLYSFGEKSFHTRDNKKADSLLPEYDKEGRPRHVYLGKIYAELMPQEDFEKFSPYDVLKNHALGNIEIETHPTKYILKEGEISFHGYFPENYLVCSMPVRCPSFHGEYKIYYEAKYGLTIDTYKIWQGKSKRGELGGNEKNVKRMRKKLYNIIIEAQEKSLKSLIDKYVLGQNGQLKYPGFKGEFLDQPLSSKCSDLFAQIKGKKNKALILTKDKKSDKKNPQVTPFEAQYLLEELKGNETIEYLTIRGIQINEEHVVGTLIHLLKSNKTIKTLKLEGIDFTPGVFTNIALALKGQGGLSTLGLRSSKIEETDLSSFIDILGDKSTLTSIDIRGVKLSRANGEKIKDLFIGKQRKNTDLIDLHYDTEGLDGTLVQAIDEGIDGNIIKKNIIK